MTGSIVVPVCATIAAVAATIVFYPNTEITAIHYAVGQMAPMAAMLVYLVTRVRFSAGKLLRSEGLR
jgi:hypothetical protein